MHGLRIRERLQKQYASAEADEQGAPLEQPPQQPLQPRESWLDTDESEVGPSVGLDRVELGGSWIFFPCGYSNNRGDTSLLQTML